jgi:hypothetical protein
MVIIESSHSCRFYIPFCPYALNDIKIHQQCYCSALVCLLTRSFVHSVIQVFYPNTHNISLITTYTLFNQLEIEGTVNLRLLHPTASFMPCR